MKWAANGSRSGFGWLSKLSRMVETPDSYLSNEPIDVSQSLAVEEIFVQLHRNTEAPTSFNSSVRSARPSFPECRTAEPFKGTGTTARVSSHALRDH